MGYRTTKMQRGGSTVILLILLLAAVAAMVGIYSYAAVQARYYQEYRNLTDLMRSSTQQMDKHAELAAAGDVPAFTALKRYRDRLEQAILQLQGGNIETGLPPLSRGGEGGVEKLAVLWRKYRNSADTILAYQEDIFRLREAMQNIRQSLPELQSVSEEIATALIQRGAYAGQVYIATRQLMLLQRVGRNLDLIVSGGEQGRSAMEELESDLDRFGQVVNGMLNGDQSLGVIRIRHREVRQKLEQLSARLSRLEAGKRSIAAVMPVVSKVGTVAQEMNGGAERLLDAIEGLEQEFSRFDTRLQRWTLFNYLLGAVALLLLVMIAFQLRREDKQRLAASEEQKRLSEEQNQRNQQAILRLLDEMGTLADGDLTVQATVTEDITGAIADSVNYAVDALRHLVRSINDTTRQVSGAAQEVQSTTQRLAEDSGRQADQIRDSASEITAMADAVEKISADAANLAEQAKHSVASAGKGAQVVRDTVQGMDTIREQIQETSKRIKRLGESSQEIGNIVELINDIAEQTNILALNASLQAAMAGESGRAFSVVAGEVQQLAERSANATRDIETLVRTIQADTSEAVISMEQSTEEVVAGTRLAKDAGEHLENIEKSTQHLAELIQDISREARQHAEAASGVSAGMNEIQSLSMLTSEGLNRATEAIGHLADSVNTLKKSVAGFKLPQ